MQVLAATGQIALGFELLAQAEADRLIIDSAEGCYPIFYTLLEACRAAGDSNPASPVQAAVGRLSLIACAPEAKTFVNCLDQQYENGFHGAGVAEAQNIWLELCRRTAYAPHLDALPWAFVENSTHQQQEGVLQLHAEKKALAMLLASGETA